jgi:hypothetical protein
MATKRHALLLILVGALLAAFATDARAGRPKAKILQTAEASGSHLTVTLNMTDKASRAVDLLIEYKVKGLKGWHPATIDSDLTGMATSPDGVETNVFWNAHADLGSVHAPKVRLRTSVTNMKGGKKKSKKFEVVLYGQVSGDELAADLAADLEDNGTLDDLVLIDTRSALSFGLGHIPGAINLSVAEIETGGTGALPYPLDKRIVFYCYGGT